MGHPFVISRKITSSIRRGMEILNSGKFTEIDVKLLLLDLREVSKYVRDQHSSNTDQFTTQNREFIEICDFIAHSSRDRGIIETNVRNHVEVLHKAFSTATVEDFQKIPVKSIIKANTLSMSLAMIAYICLSAEDKNIDIEHFSAGIQQHQSDIALCILSLLQDSIIELKNKSGFGILHILPYEGFYRLYCRVLNSTIEQETRSHTSGTGRLFIGFPVMSSDAKCSDPLHLSINPESIEYPLFETFRDTQGRLQLVTLPK